MPSFVDEVRAKANGHWEPILERLGISTNRKGSRRDVYTAAGEAASQREASAPDS
ncbi:hypothetical protein SGGMMB4_03826 [Sodalis glossinidius str. 'morsitans']|uniref:Uncharacterized protein n=1 Tax=Sodalis glossinidius (strain morsitans) TaxID=343509 RepID=A0A193QLI3_SODGM|nr:hypothetical protein SGGMMB4_03826 [Sodalis glossinidius str. 'morsitans']